jgi:polysaccharide biosynthesis protein PslG
VKFRAFGPRRLFSILMLLLLLVASTLPASAGQKIDGHVFDMSMNAAVIGWDPEPWPTVSFSSMRLWDTGTTWFNINTAEGVYDWSVLDEWLAAAGSNHNNEALYTFGGVPQWASSKPNDPTCRPQPGACDAPRDLNPDGTGTDRLWKDFITALVQHNQNSQTARIRYWEMWNEPHNNFFWNGTYLQLVRMVADAYSIIKTADPDAVVLSVTVGWSAKASMTWFKGYIAAGGGRYIDKISCHGYAKQDGGKYGPPENIVTYLVPYRSSLAALGLGSTQIWDTEANWGQGLLTDRDMQAAWVARFYLLHISEAIGRLYWFVWNGGSQGGLWAPDPHDRTKQGTLLKAGIAYQQLRKWVIGTSITSRCSNQGSIWSCQFAGSSGYKALAVWDTSATCQNGQCGTTQYGVNNSYLSYLTLDGNKYQIKNSQVPIGAKPIFVQNQ